jgi:hypothetical protein
MKSCRTTKNNLNVSSNFRQIALKHKKEQKNQINQTEKAVMRKALRINIQKKSCRPNNCI